MNELGAETKSIEAVQVNMSQMCTENQHDQVVTDDLKAGVAGLKVNTIDSTAENKCFYNMFREATKLIVVRLLNEVRVKMVTMYEILVAVHQHQYSRLLK